MLFTVCQELFQLFYFSFLLFELKAFVLRRFRNSEIYNTIVSLVCQQLFSVFSTFMNKKKILCAATVN